MDIIKALPDKAQVTISIEGERATVRSDKSRFTLATLPASEIHQGGRSINIGHRVGGAKIVFAETNFIANFVEAGIS